MDSDSVVETNIHSRTGLIQMPMAARNQSNGELTHLFFRPDGYGGIRFEPRTPVHPNLARSIDQDVRDERVGGERAQHRQIQRSTNVFLGGHRGAGSRTRCTPFRD